MHPLETNAALKTPADSSEFSASSNGFFDHLSKLDNESVGLFPFESVKTCLSGALLAPASDMLTRPSKGFRSMLVELAYDLSGPKGKASEAKARQVRTLGNLLEAIHAGSLIIDDIEDGTPLRRGKPALHVAYGMPLALNTGNWLYFWPLLRLPELGLKSEQELAIYRCVAETLSAAHCGQAVDLGTDVTKLSSKEITVACSSSLFLKSGMLMGLAMELGAILAHAPANRRRALVDTGRALGVGLQMLDDVGTLLLPPDDPKRFEDLRLRRPSWIWSVAADFHDSRELDSLKTSVRSLPLTGQIEVWLERSSVPAAAATQAKEHMHRTLDRLGTHLRETGPAPRTTKAFAMLESLVERISHAYF